MPENFGPEEFVVFFRLCFIVVVLFGASLAHAEAPTQPQDHVPFDRWLADLRAEALKNGIRPEILDAAFANVTYDPGVVKADRNQPEFRQTYAAYMSARVSDERIRMGQKEIRKHWDELQAVGAAYGVQPRFIAAIWGMETNYGRYTGGKNVIQALATLAYNPRRGSYFRKELLIALNILNEGDVAPAAMKGSWAGAMGQAQFMPSSFQTYAEDFNGDGRRDIWTTPVDVFASIAKYLKSYGWRDDRTWGRRVRLPKDFDERLADNDVGTTADRCALRDHIGHLSLADWAGMGVRRANGNPLPDVAVDASLVRPAGEKGPAFLTYGNFRAILRYNCSNFYALAVGHLADALKFRRAGGNGAQ